MQTFNDREAIKKIDPQDTLASTEQFAKQCEVAWNEVMSKKDVKRLESIKNIVFCGMGASIYGGLVVRSLEEESRTLPTEIVTGYHIPDYVDQHTLVVLTSYSGTTEETVSCAKEAMDKQAKMLIITKGGDLATFARDGNIPSYIFDGKLNPAGVPRLGNGYTILGLIGMLSRLGVIVVEEKEITDAITRLHEKVSELRDAAIKDSEQFVDTIPVVIAAAHLSGNAHILRNQFNETSKTFSSYFLVPDLNHHLMEGLQAPNAMPIRFLIIDSPNYEERIKRRIALTDDVIKQNKRNSFVFSTNGQTLYDDFLETLVYGSYLTLFLSLRYDQNPAINPWVDYFKEQLKK
ncbi:MAG: hypothetical protein HY430_01955 [Candidatus Levybacteria bacterium]|nr:hypothetical protein [Candidatus Levybacteria bacterium]